MFLETKQTIKKVSEIEVTDHLHVTILTGKLWTICLIQRVVNCKLKFIELFELLSILNRISKLVEDISQCYVVQTLGDVNNSVPSCARSRSHTNTISDLRSARQQARWLVHRTEWRHEKFTYFLVAIWLTSLWYSRLSTEKCAARAPNKLRNHSWNSREPTQVW